MGRGIWLPPDSRAAVPSVPRPRVHDEEVLRHMWLEAHHTLAVLLTFTHENIGVKIPGRSDVNWHSYLPTPTHALDPYLAAVALDKASVSIWDLYFVQGVQKMLRCTALPWGRPPCIPTSAPKPQNPIQINYLKLIISY